MKRNPNPAINSESLPATHHIGAKAFYLEPWLVLGSSLLWLVVLPFAGLVALADRVQAGGGFIVSWIKRFEGNTDVTHRGGHTQHAPAITAQR